MLAGMRLDHAGLGGGYIIGGGGVGQYVFLLPVANPQSCPLVVQLSLTPCLLLLLTPGPVCLSLRISLELLTASLPQLQEVDPAAVETTHQHLTKLVSATRCVSFTFSIGQHCRCVV